MEKIKRTLTTGSNAGFVIRVGGNLISFLLQVMLARLLGVESYGDYIYVITLVNILHIFGKVGFDRSSLRFIPSYQINEQCSLTKGFLLQSNKITLLCSVSLSIVSLIIIWLLHGSIRSDLIALLGLASILLPLKSFSVMTYAKIQAFKHVVLSQFLQLILEPLILGVLVLICFLVAQAYFNAKAALVINITATFVVTIVALGYLRRYISKELFDISPSFKTSEWMKVSFILSLTIGFNLILQETDVIMIGMIQDTTESGIYKAAQRVSHLLRFGLIAINAIVAPLIAESFAANQMDQLQYISTFATRRMSAIAIFVCILLVFWGDKILALFGNEFQSAYVVLLVLGVGQIVNAFAGPVGVIMGMTNNQNFSLYLTVFSAVVNVALNYLFINLYGIIGAAIATSITLSFWNITQALVVRRRLGVNPTIFVRN